MAFLGQDFRAARQGWLYDERPGQRLWLAALLAVALFFVYGLLQYALGVLIYTQFVGGTWDWRFWDNGVPPVPDNPDLFGKASILGMLPAALLSVAITYWASGLGNAEGRRGLPLHLPKLGAGGWLLLISGFVIVMYAIFAGTFAALGIDPQTYTPAGGGASEQGNSAGMVEKIIADLADEPLLFALAVPGITIAVPMVEEMIFRGAVFSALVRSPVGRTGAVLITAAIFALMHGVAAPWLFVGIIFLMGVVLGLLLLRFGSLAVTIACHCVWNSLSSLVLFGVQNAS